MNTVSRLSTATVAARIPYANAAPFYALWADAPFAVRNLVPRELGREAEAGSVDLGLMACGAGCRACATCADSSPRRPTRCS